MTTLAFINLECPGESTTNLIMQKLLTADSTLKNNIKLRQKYPRKQPHDSNGDKNSTSCDGDNDKGHNSDQESDLGNEMEHNGSDGSRFVLSEEGKVFLESFLDFQIIRLSRRKLPDTNNKVDLSGQCVPNCHQW